ncbi:MAG: indole-3-glycerol phosphate synthase TrpC [Pseudomonadota bacterium]
MADILEKIGAYKAEEIAALKARISYEDLADEARTVDAPRGFTNVLMDASRSGYGLIAEIKKASPSKGLIREDFDVAALAQAYQAGGAACLSVLTDTPSFQGAPEFLMQAREATTLPVIRKDFLYDPIQVVEARALGADAILIIMAAISDAQAEELEATAMEWGMDVLVEVHDLDELKRAEALKSPLLGINNRNLKTFEVTLETTKTLARYAAPERVLVAESGLFTPSDLSELCEYGARCFLIGEALMRQDDVTAATKAILASPTVAPGF